MPKWPVHARIDGPIVMIGFGSIGKGTLPLIERRGITLVGVSISNLDDDLGQLRLPLDGHWSDTLDDALDEVRLRFGSAAITRAVLLGRRQGLTVPLLPD